LVRPFYDGLRAARWRAERPGRATTAVKPQRKAPLGAGLELRGESWPIPLLRSISSGGREFKSAITPLDIPFWHHSALRTVAREEDVYQRCGVRVAPAHEEPRSGSNNSEHESTSGRSTNYESGRLIRVFRDIGRIFSLLFLLSHPLPVGHRLRKRVQKRKTEYGFVEGKNGFNCISCGTPRVERRILRQNENPAGLCEGARAGSREPSVECRTNYCCYEGSARKTRKRARGSSRNFRHDKLKGIHS
jgi:hypothetical protein